MKIEIVDYDLESEIKKLVDFAEKHPFSMDELLDIYNKQELPPGDREGFFLMTPFGIRIVYSVENQHMGQVRHLSVSIDANDKLPPVILVEAIMQMIGFENKLEKCKVAVEKYGNKRKVVNVLELKGK